MTLSSVVFRNMSSEPKPQPSPRPAPRRAGNRAPVRPDPARYSAPDAAEPTGVPGCDPGDPATWPGDVPAAGAEPAADQGTGPAPADGEVTLTDAKVMRALAHPLRMALLELFSVRQTLTATQASEALGESPANCAFHLRTLAKYGFVREAGGGRGRERPWTLASRSVTLTTNQPDPQAALAAGELGRLWLERWMERARRTYGFRNEVPGWDGASGWSTSYVFLTPDETIRLRGDISRLLKRYEDRLTDPAVRPEGALPVEWSVFASPLPELAEPGPAAGPEGPDAAGRR
jgi:Helix-turn-helix domain